MHLYHLTLNTGHSACTSRADVSGEAIETLRPWLSGILNTGEPSPIPVPALRHFTAQAFVKNGGLIVTVYAPIGPYEPGQPPKSSTPLITFGVAQRSRHAKPLWQLLLDSFDLGKDLALPRAPWCAVVLHPAIWTYSEALSWIADFERCLAWTWITRNKKEI